jgi:hypothetical protein
MPNPNTSVDLSQIPDSPQIPLPGEKEKKEQEALLKDMERANRMRGTVHWWKRCFFAISFIFLIIIIIVRLWALVTPAGWHWLTDEQTSKIDEFFVHGTIGAIIAGYLGKYFREEKRGW